MAKQQSGQNSHALPIKIYINVDKINNLVERQTDQNCAGAVGHGVGDEGPVDAPEVVNHNANAYGEIFEGRFPFVQQIRPTAVKALPLKDGFPRHFCRRRESLLHTDVPFFRVRFLWEKYRAIHLLSHKVLLHMFVEISLHLHQGSCKISPPSGRTAKKSWNKTMRLRKWNALHS